MVCDSITEVGNSRPVMAIRHRNIPQANNATEICRLDYHSKHPVGILMPSDILHYATQNYGGTFDYVLPKAVENAPKYSTLAAYLVWVCFSVVDVPQHMACTI